MKPNSSKTLKISVVVIIVSMITGIWFVKNEQEKVNLAEFAELVKMNEEDQLGEGESVESNEGIGSNYDFALHVTESLDLDEMMSKGLPIIIDFGADSCLPCKEMAPVLMDLNAQMQGKAMVKFVDVWKYQKLAEGFPIRVIPTQIFIDADGKPFVPKDPEGMKMVMYTSNDTGEHVFTTHEGPMNEEELLKVLSEMGVD